MGGGRLCSYYAIKGAGLMVVEVEETPEDDPYNDGFVTFCLACEGGLVLILPNYLDEDGESYFSCNNTSCELHTPEGPQV